MYLLCVLVLTIVVKSVTQLMSYHKPNSAILKVAEGGGGGEVTV